MAYYDDQIKNNNKDQTDVEVSQIGLIIYKKKNDRGIFYSSSTIKNNWHELTLFIELDKNNIKDRE